MGPLQKKALFFVRAPPPGPLRRGVVPLTGYRGMSLAPFFRLRESSNPRPKGHIEIGSTLTTNWASSSVGSESAPHFNMSLWSWVRALTEAKEKGKGHNPIACEWDHPSSEWARGWGPYKKNWGALSLPTELEDQRDILKWGALSLPTRLVAQLVVRVLPISICPFGLGFELSRRRKKRARDMPL